jgi:hypothetical protein
MTPGEGMHGDTRGVAARVAAAVGWALVLVLSACITEHERPQRGMHIRSGSGGGTASDVSAFAKASQSQQAGAEAAQAAAGIGSGPVGKPATNAAVLVSRVVVGVRPLGSIVYDGQVLPLVSPDGNLMAVQEGETLQWPALAALPEQRPPTGTRLVVYDIREAPARRLELPELPMDQGLVLGRSTDASGFLVESIREDGARWIGRVRWASGRLEWLANGAVVCAHGVLTPRGDLLFSRRAIGSMTGELVLRRQDGKEFVRTDPSGSYDLAVIADDGGHAVAFIRGESGIDAEAISMSEERPGSGVRRFGATISRRRVVDSIDPAMVFQLVAGLQGPPPASGSSADRGAGAVFLHPPLKRMVVYDAVNGSFLPLAPESMSAVRWSGEGSAGYFCTTPKDLVFTSEPSAASISSATSRRSDARVLATPLVPRVTNNPERGLIVIGPIKGDPFRLAISAIHVGPPTQ